MTQADVIRTGASTRGVLPQIPILRFGREYGSMDLADVPDHRDATVRARAGQANAGLIRRDLERCPATAAAALRAIPPRRRFEICARAAELFRSAALPVDAAGEAQTPARYLDDLAATAGLPHALGRRNMEKIHLALCQMERIVAGLSRGLDPELLRAGAGSVHGMQMCFAPAADCLGVVLPGNSPGVNSIWLPALALGVPVAVKPGRLDPWTPLRIMRALVAAGMPPECCAFYPTDHEGAAAILAGCGRGMIFGDDRTTAPYASNRAVQAHGAGRSKVLIGPDLIERWPEWLDVLEASILDNGGRSCINASSILVPARAREIAEALARRLAPVAPRPMDDPEARLAAFPEPAIAQRIDEAIERGVRGGAMDLTAAHRDMPRLATLGGSTFLRPTILLCPSLEHPLANTEFLFPFASVVQVDPQRVLHGIGHSLAVTVISRDPDFVAAWARSPDIQRLNIGPMPTSRVEWDQPHDGNLFDFLWTRKAIQRAPEW